jgi:hypothetical protein
MVTNLRTSLWSPYIKNGEVSSEFQQKRPQQWGRGGVAVRLGKKSDGRKKGLVIVCS